MRPALLAALLLLPLPAAAETLACEATQICRGEACTEAEGQGFDLDTSGGGIAVATDHGPAEVTGASEEGGTLRVEIADGEGGAWITLAQGGAFTLEREGGLTLTGHCR